MIIKEAPRGKNNTQLLELNMKQAAIEKVDGGGELTQHLKYKTKNWINYTFCEGDL